MIQPYYADESVTLHLGDCLDVLRTLEADSIDAIVTDPPAGIAFMDREWDDFRRARNPADTGRDSVFGRTSARGPEYGRRDRGQFVEWLTARMAEAYRVLKPGGHALVWSIPRTSHWTAWAIEDAGFDIRDCIPHLFGSGFPKSHNVSVAIDKALGAEREVVGEGQPFGRGSMRNRSRVEAGYRPTEVNPDGGVAQITAPATKEAARWEGWGTALKPGQEMWWLVRKPLAGTVAANVLEFGTGAINVDGCRVAAGQDYLDKCASVVGLSSNRNGDAYGEWTGVRADSAHDAGRWPPNILLTHSASCDDQCAPDCPVAELDRQTGVLSNCGGPKHTTHDSGMFGIGQPGTVYTDTGGASRFYPTFRYAAKAPASERPRLPDGTAHETVKSLDLMRWLVRLITPPGGTVLDMFAGSGPTAEACVIEGFRCILAEDNPKSAELIETRLSKPIQPTLFGDVA